MFPSNFTTLFFNTALLPWIAVTAWTRDKPVPRAGSIGHDSWGVGEALMYCEVWQKNYYDNLRRRYPSRSFYSYFEKPGGLCSVLKAPIKKRAYLNFTNDGHGWDWFSGKGVMLTRGQTKEGPVDFYNTHLQAHDGKKEQKTRLAQIAETVAFMKKNSNAETPVILAGDMNINGMDIKSANYCDMMDCLATYRPVEDGNIAAGKPPLETYIGMSPGWKNRRLDYIFLFNPTKGNRKLKVTGFDHLPFRTPPSTGYCTKPFGKKPKECSLSDHGGVKARFETLA